MRTFPMPRQRVLAWLAAATLLATAGVPCRAQTEREFAAARAVMVETDVALAGIKDRAILAAMRDVPRHEFVPPEMRAYSYFDLALPIGEQQTISPPYIVAYMTEKLALKPTDNVLEIGTGSGYQAAILSRLVKEVYTIEIVDTLADRAGKAFARLGYRNIHLRVGDGYQGWPEHAPFDKIMVTCSPERVPQALVDQLREGGRIVIPVGERYQQMLYSLVKREGKMSVEAREPTFFVPMTGQAESVRERRPNEPLTPLVNGDFEERLDETQPVGWFYLRQAQLDETVAKTPGERCLAFHNQVTGCSSQALQAMGLDGRKISQLEVSLRVRARQVRRGDLPHQQARVLVTFFNADRAPVGQAGLEPWQGTFDWSQKSGQLAVPPETRTAMIAVGLLGATGELACDDLQIRAAPSRRARR